jgi:hypothetical protein
MQIQKITLHKMQTQSGREVEYARIYGKQGSAFVGQSVMLHRLSSEQLLTARQLSDSSGQDGWR